MATDPLTVPAFGPFPQDDSYFIQLSFRVGSPASTTEYAEAFIDNVVVNAILIPEPDGGLVVFIAMAGMIGRWRRKIG